MTSTVCRTVPLAACSTCPGWSDFRGTCRLTAFSWRTCHAAFSRSSVPAAISIFSFSRETEVPVPLKSNRCEISRAAWSTALRTSCRSTSDTMSNENWSFAMGQS